MAKRQTRRSISVSRSTYERLRAYCETNGISMSQFVEHRVGDFLGRSIRQPAVPRTAMSSVDERREAHVAVPSAPVAVPRNESENQPAVTAAPAAPVVLSAAATAAPTRTAITPRPAQPAPPPAKLKPEQIFTF